MKLIMRVNFQIFSHASTNQFIKQCLLRITIKYISFNVLSLFQFFFNPLQFTYSQFSILNSLHLLLIIENKLQYLELDRKQSLDIRNFRFTKAYELAGRGGLIVIPRPWYRETQAQSFPRASSWNYYGSFRSSRGYKSFESI